MKGFSYIITRDYGFAPNPFHGVCTLATCKPVVRRDCTIGDYVIGLSPRDKGRGNKLILLMRVTDVTTFDAYWNDPRFICKRPVMNGSNYFLYGDNIYHHNNQGVWVQEDSHHTNEDGTLNMDNLKRDTGKTDRVLISTDFYYFGKECITLPPDILNELTWRRGQRHLTEDVIQRVVDYVESVCPQKGYLGEPHKFRKFKRYNGKS